MHDSSIPTPRRKNDDEKKKIINPKTVQSKIKKYDVQMRLIS